MACCTRTSEESLRGCRISKLRISPAGIGIHEGLVLLLWMCCSTKRSWVWTAGLGWNSVYLNLVNNLSQTCSAMNECWRCSSSAWVAACFCSYAATTACSGRRKMSTKWTSTSITDLLQYLHTCIVTCKPSSDRAERAEFGGVGPTLLRVSFPTMSMAALSCFRLSDSKVRSLQNGRLMESQVARKSQDIQEITPER